MLRPILTVLFVAVLFARCSDPDPAAGTPSARQSDSVRQQSTDLWDVDSLRFTWYPDPVPTASSRSLLYRDSAGLSVVSASFALPVEVATECRQQGKLQLFRGGQMIKEAYVSDSCGYLSFFDAGKSRFAAVSPALKTLIDSFRRALNK